MIFTAIAAVGAFLTGGALAAGVTGLAAVSAVGVGATIVGAAAIGAVIGGAVAAVKGESILKGALKGGLIGAAAGGLLGWGAAAVTGGQAAAAGTEAATLESIGMDAGASMTGLAETGVTASEAATAGQAALAAEGAAGGAAGAGNLAGFWSGLESSDKALLLSSGASMVSGALGPDEEDLLERKAELERQAMKISGIGDINKLHATVDWKKFDMPKFEGMTSSNRFASLGEVAYPSGVAPSDANTYRVTPKPQAAQSMQPSQPKPQPVSMLNQGPQNA